MTAIITGHPDPSDWWSTLLQEKGIKRYAYLDGIGEGKIFPDGSESSSGTLLTDTGCIYNFWTDWDPEKMNPYTGEKTGYYTLGDPKFYTDPVTDKVVKANWWEEATPKEYKKWHTDSRYQEAKLKLGFKDDFSPTVHKVKHRKALF
ncbi:MAG: hypothetical protein Q7R54_02380 [bacterium]|nr:hypothetical protein [bacterium]